MYYRLEWKEVPANPNLANTDTCPDLDVPWRMGVKFPNSLPEPIVCPLHPKRGSELRDMFMTDIPLFSNKLISILREAGVDNLDLYQAELHSPNGEVYTDYKAVNIVGTVACADMGASEYMPGTEPPLVRFSKLIIDEQKASNHKLFRLAERPLHILVSQSVKDALDKHALVGVFCEPVEAA